MKHELTGWQRTKAIIAKWIVVRVAAKISPLAVMSLCLETAKLYHESMEPVEEDNGV